MWFVFPKSDTLLSFLVILLITIGELSLLVSASSMQILEIVPSADRQTPEEIRTINRTKNNEIIVGEHVSPHSRLVIRCNSSFPVQIIYAGAGRPEFTTFTNVRWHKDEKTFEAEASLGLLGFQDKLRAEDTGNYTCRSIENGVVVSYVFVYVPGPSLFTSRDDYDHEIVYNSTNEKTVWIPCSIAHPKAVVSIYRTASGKLQCPSLGKSAAHFDPRRGFLLNLKDSSFNKKPEGTYICIGSLNNDNFKMLEFNLVSEKSAINKTSGGGVGHHGKKGLCRPSPCGQKAECSVIDGHPVCYCSRGLGGNPYTECSNTVVVGVTADRCRSNTDCRKDGEFRIQGKCTSDMCQPNPCGTGAICVPDGDRPRCTCQIGYDGQPPFCLRKCQYNGDCPGNEVCSRAHCQNPCPNRCGTNADCHVVQSGFNKTVVCTCPPGYTGDPEDNCYDIGKKPGGEGGGGGGNYPVPVEPSYPRPQHCLPGFIGPGHPDCRKIECEKDFDCSRNEFCSAEKQCVPKSSDPCAGVCGTGAECKLRPRTDSSSVGTPVCVCPQGTRGDPFYRCYMTNSSSPFPASPSSSPTPPTSRPGPIQCFEDFECPRGFECVARLCTQLVESGPQPECRRRCGINANCVTSRCLCPPGFVGDPHIACGREPSPCDPSPCAKFAECKEINARASCRCILGYEGDAFNECIPEREGNRVGGPPRETQQHRFTVPLSPRSHVYQDSSSFPRNYEEPKRIFPSTPPTQASPGRFPSSNRFPDECDMQRPDDCGPPDFQCLRGRDGTARCVCSSQRCGYIPDNRPPPPISPIPPGMEYGRYCDNDGDCLYPEICSNRTFKCYNPCDYDNSPCSKIAFSECRVIEGKGLCSCKRGYVGNPASGLDCIPEEHDNRASTSIWPIVYCDHLRGTGCDRRSECVLLHGRGQCICGAGYSGRYPDCRQRCQDQKDCYHTQHCWRGECLERNRKQRGLQLTCEGDKCSFY